MSHRKINLRKPLIFLIVIALLVVGLIFIGPCLRKLGEILVADEVPSPSDAVVVLNTGSEFYPRLVQAAEIYRQGLANKVVFNGNRKTDMLRQLEADGFRRCCPWYADALRIIVMGGVPQKDIIWISAEDAYDTVSEAEAVGRELIRRHLKKIILTTSKSHTRRARFIWRNMYENQLMVGMVAAKSDPYDPNNWWKDGRQVRWVLAEYGAWIYYWWKHISGF